MNKKRHGLNIIHVFRVFLIICVITLVLYAAYKSLYRSQMNTYYAHPLIPNNLYQCYSNKASIPHKVYKNKALYAKQYSYEVWDYEQCSNYLRYHWGNQFYHIFNNLSVPAHKADFWRYCILYDRGGIYMDIKMELIEPLQKTVSRLKSADFATILSIVDKTCMQGFIAVKQKHPILKACIHFIKTHYKKINDGDYLSITRNMYTNICRHINVSTLHPGLNKNVYLFKEVCTSNKNDCYDGLDRYQFCCYTLDGEPNSHEKVIKSRYADYPW